MWRRSSVTGSSFPENSDPGDGDEERRAREAEPPPRMPPPWRADLLILLAAALAAIGTFLFEAWQRTHPETLV